MAPCSNVITPKMIRRGQVQIGDKIELEDQPVSMTEENPEPAVSVSAEAAVAPQIAVETMLPPQGAAEAGAPAPEAAPVNTDPRSRRSAERTGRLCPTPPRRLRQSKRTRRRLQDCIRPGSGRGQSRTRSRRAANNRAADCADRPWLHRPESDVPVEHGIDPADFPAHDRLCQPPCAYRAAEPALRCAEQSAGAAGIRTEHRL